MTTSPKAPRASSATRHARGQATSARILDAAEELFATRGFRATSLREIAQFGAVELGLITYYFGSKQNLIREVLSRRAELGQRVMHAALDRVEAAGHGGDPAAILRAFAETILSPLDREHRTGLNYVRLVIQHAAEIDDAFPADDPVMAPHFPIRARYVAALRRALPDVDPRAVQFGFDVFEGAFSKMLFDRTIDFEDSALRRARIAELRRFLVPFCSAGLAAFAAGVPEA